MVPWARVLVQFPRSNALSSAMFVFLSAAAGTRVVPPYFRAAADRFGLLGGRHRFRHHFAGLGLSRVLAAAGRFTEGGGFLMDGFLRQLAEELLEGHQAGGAAE